MWVHVTTPTFVNAQSPYYIKLFSCLLLCLSVFLFVPETICCAYRMRSALLRCWEYMSVWMSVFVCISEKKKERNRQREIKEREGVEKTLSAYSTCQCTVALSANKTWLSNKISFLKKNLFQKSNCSLKIGNKLRHDSKLITC